MSGKPYSVYVLWSASAARFYIGISEEPVHRLEQHNDAEGAHWTSRHAPWVLVHQQQFAGYSDARRRELELKAQKGGIGFFVKTGLDPSRFGRGS